MKRAPVNGNQKPPLPWAEIGFVAILFTIGAVFLGWMLVRPPLAPTAQVREERNLANEAREYLNYKKVTPLSEPMEKLLANPATFYVKSQRHELLNEPAPAFDLKDHLDRSWKLEDSLAKGPVVLVFYYGYHCNHCVSQLFALNADIARFQELGAEVVAVSADPPEMTRERYRQYGEFAFPVVSDPGNKIAQAFGVYHPAQDGKPEDLQHATFVIGQDGLVGWAKVGDEPFTGNRTLLYEIARLENRLPTLEAIKK